MENFNYTKEDIISRFKKSRAYRGAAIADISNSSIRNILTSLSVILYGSFKDEYIIETMDFFEWKCPYTGKAILDKHQNFQVDHVVPQNRIECGLNIRGNLVISDKRANELKHDLNVEDFLLIQNVNDKKKEKLERFWSENHADLDERRNRLRKIHEWQKFCGYDPIKIKRKLQKHILEIYKEIGDKQNSQTQEIIQQFEDIPAIVLHPADPDKFKDELLRKRSAKILLFNKDGEIIKDIPWNAYRFTHNSDLMHNITTKEFWKDRKKGEFIRVEVFIE